MYTEMVKFRLLVMPCCKQQICWVNPRWPHYCPECGTHIYPEIKEDTTLCLVFDPMAQLKIARGAA